MRANEADSYTRKLTSDPVLFVFSVVLIRIIGPQKGVLSAVVDPREVGTITQTHVAGILPGQLVPDR